MTMKPEELKAALDRGEKYIILDVREPGEFAIANLGGTLVPLGELTMRYRELDPEAAIVCVCHHGIRSAHAVSFLRTMGFQKVCNLSGGIDRWSLTVDASVPRY
jgi:sulfur-carrier protein adenylyltransferase/sulfurtransferase